MKYLVVGDIMIDKFVHVRSLQDRQEMNAPVALVETEVESLGGAANVACNLVRLGHEVLLCSVVGKDEESHRVTELLRESSLDIQGVVTDPGVRTITKTRVINETMEQYIRFDNEVNREIDIKVENEIINYLSEVILTVDCVIISDYAKGLCTDRLYRVIKALCRANRLPLLVDSKCKRRDDLFGVNILCINFLEFTTLTNQSSGNNFQVLERAISFVNEMNIDWFILKCAEKGVFVFQKGEKHTIGEFASTARSVSNPTGAGDTFLAILALCLTEGKSVRQAVCIANSAAGIVVEKEDVSYIDKKELDGIIEKCMVSVEGEA